MTLVFQLFIIKGERIEGGIILRKAGLPPNPDMTIGELADRQVVDMPAERPSSVPPEPRRRVA